MTPQVLAEELAKFLETAHEAYTPSDPKITGRRMQCIPGYIPERTMPKAQTAVFPYIAVRVNEVHDDADDNNESTATVHIIIGTYCEANDDGWLEIVNLVESTRRAMLKQRTIAKKFRLRGALDAVIPSEQPRPIWVAVLTATYTIREVEEELSY
ncbi:hypothetical protein [Veillonella sp.]|uniref:hypothetical protein n=1 Tax=Veillonella sp. TaxID=1926307 RepID=UPI0025F02B1E|nr:hypothetical protein [Veillonella sp.]